MRHRDREKWTGIARNVEVARKNFKWNIVVSECLQQQRFRLPQQPLKRGVSREIEAQGDWIQEVTQEALQLASFPARGRRRPKDNGFLIRISMEQNHKCREQRQEQRYILTLAQGFDRRNEFLRYIK